MGQINEWDEDCNDIELKLCPFCGGTPLQSEDNGMEVEIRCRDCEVCIYKHHGIDGNDKDYIKRCRIAWNRRVKHED